ncbi:neural-cadherin-like [Mercenaria mercenaria]|uniref:neural-cadherin-like n=1 Tax=Mercenaria mercenaria TaxID=6596 RepID=UPI00234E9BAA|nr:neural-cadherin-like [Mercenaria mercenaria]
MQMTWNLIGLLVFATLFNTGECAITDWTLPSIATADGGSGTLTAKIDHGLTAGDATGITITATSDDGGGVSSYTKDSQTPSDVVFAIDNSGVVTITSGTVAYATTAVYTFVISANDAGGTASSATVTLSVNDLPAFSATQYSLTIDDATASGTTLTTLTATDDVNGGSLTYSFASGNTNTDWAISSAGVITTANTLAASTTGGYSLVLNAADSSLTGSATVWIVVTSCSGATAVLAGFMTLLMALIAHMY